VVPPRLSTKGKGGGLRGEIRGWSAASRRRLLFGLGCLDFEGEVRRHGGQWVSVMVSYHENHDPGPVKLRDDRLKLLDAIRYRVGVRRLVWKIEFHRHGGPHLHLMVWVPFTSSSQLRAFRSWTWAKWEAISGRRNYVYVGTATARVFATYISADYTMNGRKGYQYRVPDAWQHVGRWWAIVGMEARWTTRPVSDPAFLKLHRVLRRHRQANATYKIRCGRSRRPGKMWLLANDPVAMQGSVNKYLDSLTD